jgi:AcrR family transcriptional regulator
MARRYAPTNGRGAAQTVERVLDAAVELVAEDAFHTATMDDLAQRAGVSRATVFTRFGSKLGVLEALTVRCNGGPEMAAIGAALELSGGLDALHAFVEAAVELWETQGFILIQLKSILVLEPDASTTIEEQFAAQHDGSLLVGRRLATDGALRTGWTATQAGAALHAITSVESFLYLRRDYGLSMAKVKATMHAQTRAFVKP